MKLTSTFKIFNQIYVLNPKSSKTGCLCHFLGLGHQPTFSNSNSSPRLFIHCWIGFQHLNSQVSLNFNKKSKVPTYEIFVCLWFSEQGVSLVIWTRLASNLRNIVWFGRHIQLCFQVLCVGKNVETNCHKQIYVLKFHFLEKRKISQILLTTFRHAKSESVKVAQRWQVAEVFCKNKIVAGSRCCYP